MEGVRVASDYQQRQGITPSIEHRALAGPRAQAHTMGDSVMSRYKDLALRLAVVAAFVLTLAAPIRW